MQTSARTGAMAVGGGTSTAITIRPAQASAMAAAARQTRRARLGGGRGVEFIWNRYPLQLSAQTTISWRPPPRAAAQLLAEDLGLLVGELLLGQDALLLQLAELLDLLDRVGRRGRGGRRRRGRLGVLRLGRLLLVFLLLPAVGLTPRDAVADGRRGTGDRGGAGDAA